MVGIVVVAHSAHLAEAAVELSKQMLQKGAPVAASGGTGDPQNPFGTNAIQIQKAIESVYSDDGVLVLMDMGSAILSAETALEFLNEEQRARVRLCEAPLIEGLMAAAVRAGNGGSLKEVIDEARGALAAKASQLSAEIPQISAKILPEITSAPKELRFVIQNPLGIHARPAAKFVTAAARFQSEIKVRNLSRNTAGVNAKSINSVATLGIRRGHEILISAAGPDADEALLALKALTERNFDETIHEVTNSPLKEKPNKSTLKDKFIGISIAPGIAIGPLIHYVIPVPEITERKADDPEVEWQRLKAAITSAQHNLLATRDRISVRSGDYESAIFDAHYLCLDDPAVLEAARREIFQQGFNAETSWQKAMDGIIDSIQSLDDVYLRSRSADLVDLKIQVLQILTGSTMSPFELNKPAVLVAFDLKPSDIARLDSNKILGICTGLGSASSHSAILSRALGVPVVFALGPEIVNLEEGDLIAVNGSEGWALANPPDTRLYEKQLKVWQRSQKAAQKTSQQPAITLDGKHIKVMANVASSGEARKAILFGAEGVGLLRTEFLFLERASPPTEEEQYVAYKSIAEALGICPLIIRTLDAGGDKSLPFLLQTVEDNPFLGERGIRVCLNHPEVFKTQLKAILRASLGHKIKVMFPFVSSITEFRQARALLSEALSELRRSGTTLEQSLEIGIMVETPSAAIMADRLAREVGFFSIGTNDLSQYVMAADRTNRRGAAISDAFNPAVLRLIQQIVKSAHAAGISAAVCGEMAGQTPAVPLLLGLGVDALSMNLSDIAKVKQTIAGLKISDAEQIAAEALELDSAEEVKSLVEENDTSRNH